MREMKEEDKREKTRGLVDAHIHIALNHLFNKQLWVRASLEIKRKWLRMILQEYKKQGIYFLRDGGDGIRASELAREVAAEEGMIFKSPICALYKKGYYGSFLGEGITDRDDFIRKFNMLLPHRPDHLKIVLTGTVSFQKYGEVREIAFTLDELKFMVDKAGEHDIPVMVHANGVEGVERAIAAGVHTIEHGYLLSEGQLYKMAERGIVWVPTLSPLGNILNSSADKFKEREKEVIRRLYEEQLIKIKKALEAGVPVALGSDAGAYAVEHGKGLINEMEHLQKIGLSWHEVEKICFVNGLRALKIEKSHGNIPGCGLT